MKIFDTHAHYDDPKYDALDSGDRLKTLREVFESGKVGYIAGMGTDLETSRKQLFFAGNFDGFFAACGFHPENIDPGADIERSMSELEKLLSHPKAVAVGEIGLDYYWEENPPREIQKMWFEAQLALAQKLDLPVAVHDREAHGDCFDIICKFPKVRGVMHCYSGSPEMARELVKRGYYISFTGNVTYKNSKKLWESIKAVPHDRLMIETDCPYMAPVPLRGSINDSRTLTFTAAKGGELLGMSEEDFIALTTKNALRFYNIK